MTYTIPLPISDANKKINIVNDAFLELKKVTLSGECRPTINAQLAIEFIGKSKSEFDLSELCPLSIAEGIQLTGNINCKPKKYLFSNMLLQSQYFISDILEVMQTTEAQGLWVAVDNRQNPFFAIMSFLMKEGSYARELGAETCDIENSELSIFFSSRRHFEYLGSRFSG